MFITLHQLQSIIHEAVAKFPQTIDTMRLLSIDWMGSDVHITLDDEDIIGQFDVAYKNLGKLIGKDNHAINDLLARKDEGDPDAADELTKIVYQAIHRLIDIHGPTHVHDTKSNLSELVPVEVWQKSYGMKY